MHIKSLNVLNLLLLLPLREKTSKANIDCCEICPFLRRLSGETKSHRVNPEYFGLRGSGETTSPWTVFVAGRELEASILQTAH